MTSPAAPGFARLNPRIPLLAFTALWLAQSGCWLLRESREELGSETGTVAPLASPVPSLSFEDPLPAEAAAPLPDCPFTSKKLEALNDTSDTADSRAEAVDVPASDIMGASTSSVPMDVSSAPAETNVADRAASLRYRGYLQTHQGGLIAFVEDLESKTMHRLETGDRIHEWTLQAIARKNIILVAGGKTCLSLPRDSADPPPDKADPATPEDKPAAKTAERPADPTPATAQEEASKP